MKSWKTTLGGILLGIGTPLAAAGEGIYATIGAILSAWIRTTPDLLR